MTTKNAKNVKRTVEDTYKSLTDHQHALDLPDMYIGGTEEDTIKMWTLNENTKKIVFQKTKYIQGLHKIFDEILVNARDQRVKDPTCNEIRVTINQETGTISVWNNGDDGIPVEFHNIEQCYVPEMIFSHIRTSSHYEEKNKITGGKYGWGSKICNVYSILFNVKVIDGNLNLSYDQTFTDNMFKKTEPQIVKLKGKNKSSVQITFTPDYKRFGVDGLSDDMVALFKKRVYDIAACTNIKVTLNDEVLNMPTFETYINMHYDDNELSSLPIYEAINDRWRVGIVYDPNSGFRQISYVNGICTYKGGSHVNHVLDQVTSEIYNKIMAKNKTLKVKQAAIKDNLTIFVDSVIEDPQFDGQTKEYLNTKVAKYGSKCELSPKFIEKVCKTGIVNDIAEFAKFRAMEDLKKTDGKKKVNLKGLAKLDDAHFAGTRKAKDCTLILTEGDSAKAFALAGIELLGKDYYGVFPLKGKLLNVREATPKQLLENEEIKNIKHIMGLKHKKKYTSVNELRYGKILVLADQDYDGSHIKGLVMNFIHFFWPSLLQIPGFILSLKTPIVKVFKKTDIKRKNGITFYTLTEYQQWKESVGDQIKLYHIKYYKGLGTSTDEEAKAAFENFDQKIIKYVWPNDKPEIIEGNPENDDDDDENNEEWDDGDKTSECHHALTLGFAKNMANERKKWLEKYNRDNILDNNVQEVTYYDFIHKDLIHFSNYSLERSIPSICDGFKPSLRKILYASILRNIFKEEIKVAQLAGFVSDKAGYHHGEASLQGAIVGMAQNFVGSNNINLLLPNGAFGNRKLGGKNAASARYIFTQLCELVSLLFRDADNCVLNYVDDDGTPVEPEVYATLICMLLVNGANGIGTGSSTDIPQYNPKDIIKNTRLLIQGKEPVPMVPHYKGFKGKVVILNDKSFETHGIYEIIDENTIIIEELPIGTWTETYKTILDNLTADDPNKPIKGELFKKVIDDCGNNTIKFTLIFLDGVLQELVKKNEIEKRLQLVNKHSLNNMNAYNANGTIQKYNSVLDIMIEHHKFRLDMYVKRKEYYLKILQNKLNVLEWKIKFIDSIINGKIIVFENKEAKSEEEITQQLINEKFPMLSTNIESDKVSYDYLVNMQIVSLTKTHQQKLKNEYDEKLKELNTYKNLSVQEIWLKELNELDIAYDKWLINQSDNDTIKKPVKGQRKGRKIAVNTK